MKKGKHIVFIVIFSILLTGCSKKEENLITSYSLEQIMDKVLSSQEKISMDTCVNGEDGYNTQLTEQYNLADFKDQMDGIISRSDLVSADEIAIFHYTGKSSDIDIIKDALIQYTINRKVDFLGYVPLEVDKLDQSQVIVCGDYIAMIICNDSSAGAAAFQSCFTQSDSNSKDSAVITSTPSITDSSIEIPTPTQEAIGSDTEFVVTDELLGIAYTMYDNRNIVNAYQSQDTSFLKDDMELAVYNKCVEVIDEIITDDMDDYEKELAIHDYLIRWTHYDTIAIQQEGTHSDYADQPYGLLIKKYAICSGYTSTFQLFMDLLQIPCLSISAYSTVSNSTKLEDHAWNMVKINENWYYVDVTWDDPYYGDDIEREPVHMFFNTTTFNMTVTGHRWDDTNYPIVKNGLYLGS